MLGAHARGGGRKKKEEGIAARLAVRSPQRNRRKRKETREGGREGVPVGNIPFFACTTGEGKARKKKGNVAA